jgi:hypothetical protein
MNIVFLRRRTLLRRLRLKIQNEFGPMIEDGVLCAQTWLDRSSLIAHRSSLPLWWVLAQSRKRHRPGDPQDAFEAGFLLRLPQTLSMRCEAPTSQSISFDA